MNKKNEQKAHKGVLYIGSYGTAEEVTIHVCQFDGETGEFTVVQQLTDLENASYLTLHPNGQHLYAASETGTTGNEDGGSVASFEVDAKTGLLSRTLENTILTQGAHPCYISTDQAGRALFVANYTGGNVALLPIKEDGGLKTASSVMQNSGELGSNTARQEAPHAHCITRMGDSAFVCAVDLGIDAVVIYRHDVEQNTLTPHGECKIHSGAGPRHLIFDQQLKTGYLMNELDSTISVLKVDAELGTLAESQVISALPIDFKGQSDAADIHLSPSGRFLYSSNRGHDSIAVFAVNPSNGELTLIQHIDCGGKNPRNFAITPDGAYLLAANQSTGTVIVFSIDHESGILASTGSKLELPSPVCMKFGQNL